MISQVLFTYEQPTKNKMALVGILSQIKLLFGPLVIQLEWYILKQPFTSVSVGEQGWRSGESPRLPPMSPGFDSRTGRHKWIEFVVGSRPCSEGFSPGSPVFLPPQKPTFLNSNSIGNSRATGLSLEDCCSPPLW